MESIVEQILRQLINIVVGALVTGMWAYIKLQKEKLKLKEEAEQKRDEKIQLLMDMAHASAQERILYLSAKYQKEKWISVEDFRVFMNLVEKYERLGANGVINSAVKKVKDLPNVEPNEVYYDKAN